MAVYTQGSDFFYQLCMFLRLSNDDTKAVSLDLQQKLLVNILKKQKPEY